MRLYTACQDWGQLIAMPASFHFIEEECANWVLINDEKEFGITVHYVDDGVDTGDIIVQTLHPICDADDYASLLKKAFLNVHSSFIEQYI